MLLRDGIVGTPGISKIAEAILEDSIEHLSMLKVPSSIKGY